MKDTIVSLLGEWRIWLLIIAVALSLIGLSPNPWASGVEVTSIDDASPLHGRISTGTIIESINDVRIDNPDDLLQFDNYTGTIRMQTSEGLEIVEMAGEDLGIEASTRGFVDLQLGMDITGGTRVLLRPHFDENETYNETERDRIIDRTINTLETRLNVFGLQEMTFQEMRDVAGDRFIQIEAAGVGRDIVDELLGREGEFEAFIPITLDFTDSDVQEIVLDDETYEFERTEDGYLYDGDLLEANDSFNLGDIRFEVWETANDTLEVAGRVFSSEDIAYVHTTGRATYVRCPSAADTCEFQFQILISDEGAERFATITRHLQNVNAEGWLHLFLDREEVTDLSISSDLMGDAVSDPVVTGSEETYELAREEMNRLQSVMESGRLPVELETVQVDRISPRLGEEFIRSIVIAGLGALIAVSLIVFIKYRRKEIIIPVFLTSFSEVLIILGVASLIGWTIDLAAIAGIIAAIGSSVDDQVVITSETLSGKDAKSYSVKRRVKRAFFIVFTAAATTIVAMLTLGFVGLGMMRGFAITTIIGVLGGVLITRPAYGKLLEKLI